MTGQGTWAGWAAMLLESVLSRRWGGMPQKDKEATRKRLLQTGRRMALALLLPVVALGACSNGGGGETPVPSPSAVAQQRAPVPEWADKAVMYEVNIRQYTEEGTFRAFQDHLPRLKEMGVDILWLMPIHPISATKRNGTLGSYYAVDDYKAVNPEFGSEADFRSLVDMAHGMGFRIMLDLVANHTGWDHAWTNNPGWHTTDEAGNIVMPPGTNWADVADLDFDNDEMQAAMIDAMKYWVEEFDIDGYRADYASGVPKAFWERARAELESLKPVYMLAEDDQQISLLSRAFNANYGWQLYNIMNRLAKGVGNAEQVRKYGERLARTYPSGTYPLNFTSNHDENSWVGTEFERLGDAAGTMAALSFVMPGMPLIYSGQEAGLDKRLLFFDKDEILWDELPMQSFYTELIALKHGNPALWNGAAGGPFVPLELGAAGGEGGSGGARANGGDGTGEDGGKEANSGTEGNANSGSVLAFQRTKGGNTVVVVMNLSGEPAASVAKLGPLAGTYAVFGAGAAAELQSEHEVRLESWEYRIYTKS